ncbi:MAG: zf-HC2 domain-containing protein [Candidatus Brocadiia bacterium]|jgi:anti-sigma factor RsiW|nr:zf-HC2 domain-containing protein [Candidatus Brocadiia bacterium]
MKCRGVHRRLGAYLDGELPSEAIAEVGRHVEACATCARELGRLRRLAGLLEAVPAPEAPVGFARRVRALAEHRGAERCGAEGESVAAGRATRQLRYAATVALLLGVALGGLMSMSASRVSASRTAEAEETKGDVVGEFVGSPASGSLAETFLEQMGESL